MKPKFVKTSNASRFLAALDALKERGAEEACLMVVDGKPGLGKTSVLHWWCSQTPAVYLRAKKEWSPSWFLRELLGAMGIMPAYSFEKMFAQAVEVLGREAASAERNGEDFGLVVDEVDHIARRPSLLETIRDLSDLLEVPVVLGGMGIVRPSLTRFPQIASRVGQYVEFEPATLDDVRAMVSALCEVEVEDGLVAFLHQVSDGFLRECKEGIASIERFGRRNPGAVSVAAMDGEILLNDRKTGRAIRVRA